MSPTRRRLKWQTALPIAFAVALAFSMAACHKTTSGFERKIDVCSLISQEEVQSIQGSPVKEVKSRASTNNSFRTADCSFLGEVKTQTVVLSLVQRNGSSGKGSDPRDYWKTSFSRFSSGTAKAETEAKEDKEEHSHDGEVNENTVPLPKRIDGLGEAAFWTSNFEGGALYVLKGDLFIRVSVTGPQEEETRIDKCKAVAEKAISRL